MNSPSHGAIRKIVVLGHSGFIGSHLEASLLRSRGEYEVIGRSLPEMDLAESSSRPALTDIFDDGTAVVLCAAVKRQFGDSPEAYHQNMAIVENVIAALQARPAARVIFMSSAAVYGEETHDTAIDETTPVNPTSYYGIAKFTGECLLRKGLLPLKGTRLLCVRPPLIYGPGDQGRTYGPSGFCAAAREGSAITLWGDGTELREFLYIDDFCAILRHLIFGEFSGVLNLAGGKSHRFIDIIDCLKQQIPGALTVNQRERSKQKVDNAFKPALLRSQLPHDFTFTPLADGIIKTLRASP